MSAIPSLSKMDAMFASMLNVYKMNDKKSTQSSLELDAQFSLPQLVYKPRN